jgi:hypothetical protein
MKKYIVALFALLILYTSKAQTLSPEGFLGYKIGTKFTRHHQIVDYFKTIAAANLQTMKLEQYGTTNEGRELYLAFISSKENMANLDQIKMNNRTYASLTKGRVAPLLPNPPAIVWLSYNVHGNEPASSEAAMLTLFELLNDSRQDIKEWLQHTVVIIDPCLNPDGRDRYVNWYNTTVGKNANADAQVREHFEAYPQGRTNHYNFDLNRDWAWQTQAESKFRIKKYLEWMPQVHVDFHEQGYNEPYYFAPAAEPFHEIITPWQRSFQTQIGKNHSKYFDANGWLYFTKQIFDLFYPSYGDTYPSYNGSIGMTYEQGGIRAGLAVKTNSGDTLTLLDRIVHHLTTSLSTIEVASKNSKQLVDEFSKYFSDNAINGKNGTYKTYILTSDDANKINSVKELFDANGIVYGQTNTKGIGYNYTTNKDENILAKTYSIAVSACQARGAMATVLLEPKSKLSDSATYDITAWSLPFVYGVDGYAIKEKRDIEEIKATPKVTAISADYGVVIPYTSLNSSKLLAHLLKNNVKVRYASKPFTVDGFSYSQGTLIVLKTGNTNINWNKFVNDAASKYNVQPVVVSSGFVEKGSDFGSADVRLITAPKVALFSGEQTSATDAGESWCFFDNELEYPVSLINAADVGRLDLRKYDVIIMPEGNYRSLNDKQNMDKLKDFVKGGGRLIAIQGAVNLLAQNGDFGIKNKADKEDEKGSDSNYTYLKKYGNREREDLPSNIPGAIYKVELDNTHPLAYGYSNTYYTLKQDANIYEFMKDGWNVGIFKKDNYVAGFSGLKVKNKLKDGTLFGVYEMGNGSVVFLADNPLFRLFWENGKMLFSNAVFMVGQ